MEKEKNIMLTEDPDDDRWDKLKSWHHVHEEIVARLRDKELQNWNITLNHGPQAIRTLRHSNSLFCTSHFASSAGETFVSHYSIGSTNQISVWSMDAQEHTVPCKHERFSMQAEITNFLFIPKHRVYVAFCKDLVMRAFTDARSQFQEISAAVCSTTILCLTYNTELDELYAGGIGTLQKWKVKGSEHAAVLLQDKDFHAEIARDQWVRDIQIIFAAKQLFALCDRSIYVVSYQTGKRAHHLNRDMNSVFRCCCLYKQREYFVTGGGDGVIIVWNAVMFTQVHIFYGHRSAITALQVHNSDPFLFSSSLDGSVRIWRMDNFQKFLRVDLGEPVFKMKLLTDTEFFCQLEKEMKVYNLNQFFNLFAAVESTIYSLQLCRGYGKSSRVLASTEDGSLRFFSPVTGSTLTIIYPMPSFQILSCFAYHRETERLLTVLDEGEVLIFNCADNPCVAEEMWEPLHNDERVSSILSVDLCYKTRDCEVTENVVFSGLMNGQIYLLCSVQCRMEQAVQAHIGEVVCLESCLDIDRIKFGVKSSTEIIVSGGTDDNLIFWRINIMFEKKNKTILSLTPILKIGCLSPPRLISMYENLTLIAVERNKKQQINLYNQSLGEPILAEILAFKIILLELSMNKDTWALEYQIHYHDDDEDHTAKITTLDRCPLLGLFASSSKDGFVKIWDKNNELLRELNFDIPVMGMCFANDRGDILVGYQSHICSVTLSSYLPPEYLELILLLQFKDEVREAPIPYNHKLRTLFKYEDLHRYTVSPEKGLCKKSEQRSSVNTEGSEIDLYLQIFAEVLAADKRASQLIPDRNVIALPSISQFITDRLPVLIEEIKSRSRQYLSDTLVDNNQDKELASTLQVSQNHLSQSGYLQASYGQIPDWSSASLFNEYTDGYSERNVILNSEELPEQVRSLRIPIPEIISPCPGSGIDGSFNLLVPSLYTMKKDGYVPYALTEFEKKLLKRDPIIAPDGQIPNSVIRSKIGKKIQAEPHNKELWTPKPMPQAEGDEMPPWWGDMKNEFDDAMAEPVRVFSYTPSPVQPPTPLFNREDVITPGSSVTDTLSPEPFLQSPQPWTWGDDEDEPKRDIPTPLQPSISPQSSIPAFGKGLRKLQPLPQSGKLELKSAKMKIQKVDMEFQDFSSNKKKKKSEPRSHEKSRPSFKLSNMVVDENSTDVHLKPEEPKKKKTLPSVDMELLQRLMEEDWFPELESDGLSFELILQKLYMLLDTADIILHRNVCDYIIEIQREIGIPDNLLDKMVDRLLTQINHNDPDIQTNSIRTIRALGIDKTDLLLLLPKLVDSNSDVRLETERTLEQLTGIADKEQLSGLMESLGVIRTHDGSADEAQALKELEGRMKENSGSFGNVQNWIDSSSPTANTVSNVALEDIEKQWFDRSFQKTSGSTCVSDKGSRASDRLNDLSFSSGKDKSTLDKATSAIDYGKATKNSGVVSSPHIQDDILKEEPRQSPDVNIEAQVSDIVRDPDQVREIDAYSQTDPEITDIPITAKSTKTISSATPDISDLHLPSYDTNVSEYQDELYTSKTEAELKGLCWSRDEDSQNGGFPAQKSKSSLTLGKLLGPISDTDRTDSAFSGVSTAGLVTSDIDGVLSRNNLLWWDRESTQERTYDSGRWTPSSPSDSLNQKTPYMRDISDDNPITDYVKKQLEVLQETSSISGQSATSSRLHPTNPSLYQYYDEQAKSTSVATTIIEEVPTQEFLSTRKSVHISSETDSDIHSMSAVPSSQITDNAADTTSTVDSGIGQDRILSDSVSIRKHRTKTIREKSLRDRGQPALSPVKSAQEINIPVPSNWRQFFDTPTAQERRRLEIVKREFDMGKVSRQNGIPPISYISDEVPLLPAEEGLRLLHTVRVGERMAEETEERHQVQPIPGRLSVHTRNEQTGLSNFGIIQMQWTTGIPEIASKENLEHPTRHTTKTTALMKSRETTQSHDTSLYLPQLKKLRKTRESRMQSSHLEEFTLPHIGGALVGSPDFQWEKPLPPPPAQESRTSIPYIRHEHYKYCQHYCLAKKKMHLFTSNIRDLCHLPEVVIKQALQAKSNRRSKKRGSQSQITRHDSVLLPPISLRQLIRA